jgi:GntR family transcriptional repressor for pyruvate dehydrogenase complex
MGFEAIRRNTAPEMVVAQMLEKLRSGELVPGTRLPSQRELALSFGVGRSSIREALNALAVMGYLDVQQGRGTFVAAGRPESEPSMAKLKAALKAGSLLDLIELRETLECRAAELAAERCESGHIHRLKQLLEDMQAGAGDYRRFLAADLEFHATLAEATANPIFSEMLRLLLQKVVGHHDELRTGLLSPAYRGASIRTLEALLGCIEREDATGAAQWMREHLNAIRLELKDIL